MNRFPLSARPGAPSPASPARVELTSPAHYISRRLVARGDTPFAEQMVEIVDPDTGERVGEPVRTDAEGNLFVEVPEDKPYHIRVVDDDEPDELVGELGEVDMPDSDVDEPVLTVRLVDASGVALANVEWRATGPGGTFTGTTDAEGDVEYGGVAAGVYEVTVQDKTIKVHTLHRTDIDPEKPNTLIVS